MPRTQRSLGTRLLLGEDPDEIDVWLTIASRVFAFTLAAALLSVVVGVGLLGALANFLLVIFYFAGLFLAVIESYKNDGFLLALTVAVAPTLATLVAILVSIVVRATVGGPPNAVYMLQNRIGGLLFVAVGTAAFAFVLGAGARRLVSFGGAGKVRGP